MNILLTNDDGIYASGLAAIYHEFASLGEVTVVAPESEQSAVGHAISLNQPLRVRPVSMNGAVLGWAVSGTPADCVKIAIAELLPAPPDLVISGINLGPNVGINVLYSGTVSAATEASILGVKAVAFSLDTYKHADFPRAALLARQVLVDLLEWPGWTPNICLNVNLPDLPLGPGWRGLRFLYNFNEILFYNFNEIPFYIFNEIPFYNFNEIPFFIFNEIVKGNFILTLKLILSATLLATLLVTLILILSSTFK